MRVSYEPWFPIYNDQIEDARRHAGDPHPKKNLRVQCLKELEETGDIHADMWLKTVLYKQKGGEYAKPGKNARGIGDLGVAASLQGFRLTEQLKSAQAEQPIYYKDSVIIFIKKPDTNLLASVFAQLISPTYKNVFVYHSDDACMSTLTPEGVKTYNMDISSCDTSHGPEVFKALCKLVPKGCQRQMGRLVNQCRRPMRVQSYSNKKNVVVMVPTGPVLYSGATITTAINNLANVAIAIAIIDNPQLHPVEAARLAGYNITLTECKRPQEIQFLKCSPIMTTTGVWWPVLNPGVLLRASGACRQDLPGRGPWRTRAKLFQAALLHGYMTHMSNPWLDAQRANASTSVRITKDIWREVAETFEHKVYNSKRFSVTDEELFARYDLNAEDEEDLKEFAEAQVGESVGNGGLHRILMKDYGIGCS